MTISLLLERSPAVIAFCRGRRALRGVPRWDPRLGREPHFVVLTVWGSIVLIDVVASRQRVRTLQRWCAAATAAGEWRFVYRRVTPTLLLGLLHGAIA